MGGNPGPISMGGISTGFREVNLVCIQIKLQIIENETTSMIPKYWKYLFTKRIFGTKK